MTTYAFRSSFRTWAAEYTNSPREVVEATVIHVIADKVDLFEKRRRLMAEWASCCSLPTAARPAESPETV
jgi:hypothetical protein